MEEEIWITIPLQLVTLRIQLAMKMNLKHIIRLKENCYYPDMTHKMILIKVDIKEHRAKITNVGVLMVSKSERGGISFIKQR